MGKIYIFRFDEYVRHSYARGPDPGYPKKVHEIWSGWPESWERFGPYGPSSALFYCRSRVLRCMAPTVFGILKSRL